MGSLQPTLRQADAEVLAHHLLERGGGGRYTLEPVYRLAPSIEKDRRQTAHLCAPGAYRRIRCSARAVARAGALVRGRGAMGAVFDALHSTYIGPSVRACNSVESSGYLSESILATRARSPSLAATSRIIGAIILHGPHLPSRQRLRRARVDLGVGVRIRVPMLTTWRIHRRAAAFGRRRSQHGAEIRRERSHRPA